MLTLSEVKNKYGYSRSTLLRWEREGKIHPQRTPGGHRRYIEGELDKQAEGLYDRMNGIGAHEVVIESPNHEDQFAYLAHDQMILTFRAFRDRIRDLSRDDRFSYVMVFKNFGKPKMRDEETKKINKVVKITL